MNISNVLCSAAAVLVAAALPIRSAQAQVPASHAVGSPWFEQAGKKVQDCGAAYRGPLTGGTKAAADAAARQFDQFVRKCYPQIDEYYAANKAWQDEQDKQLAQYVFKTSATALYRLISTNAISAANKIGTRVVEIHGSVERVDAEPDGTPIIVMDDGADAPAMLLELANNRFANAAAAALTSGKHIIVACGDVIWSEGVVSGQGCAIQ